MKSIAPVVLGVVLLNTAGCSLFQTSEPVTVTRELYCDSYFIYDMCALDFDRDGATDVLYFEDTNEVFMHGADSSPQMLAAYDMHPCVQVMDESMQEATDRLLTISKRTTYGNKLAIRRSLLVNYSRYAGRVGACHRALSDDAIERNEEPFGDQFDSEFGS